MESVEQVITEFIVREFLAGDSAKLTRETPLMAAGIIDSLGAILLVEFIESRFGVKILAHEADGEHMGTIALLASLVSQKQAAAN